MNLSSLLATGGDLLFGGDPDGDAWALDATTGERLWSFNTGGGISSAPMAYAVNGREYIAIGSGMGALHGSYVPRWWPDAPIPPAASTLFVFALPTSVSENGEHARRRPAPPAKNSRYSQFVPRETRLPGAREALLRRAPSEAAPQTAQDHARLSAPSLYYGLPGFACPAKRGLTARGESGIGLPAVRGDTRGKMGRESFSWYFQRVEKDSRPDFPPHGLSPRAAKTAANRPW